MEENRRLPLLIEQKIIDYYLVAEVMTIEQYYDNSKRRVYMYLKPSITTDDGKYYCNRHDYYISQKSISTMSLVCWKWFQHTANFFHHHILQPIYTNQSPDHEHNIYTLYKQCTQPNSIKYHIFNGRLPENVYIENQDQYGGDGEGGLTTMDIMKVLLKDITTLMIDHSINMMFEAIPWSQLTYYAQNYFDDQYEDNIEIMHKFIDLKKEQLESIKWFDATLYSDHFYDNFDMTILQSLCNMVKTRMPTLQQFNIKIESQAFGIEFSSFYRELAKIIKKTVPKSIKVNYKEDSEDDEEEKEEKEEEEEEDIDEEDEEPDDDDGEMMLTDDILKWTC